MRPPGANHRAVRTPRFGSRLVFWNRYRQVGDGRIEGGCAQLDHHKWTLTPSASIFHLPQLKVTCSIRQLTTDSLLAAGQLRSPPYSIPDLYFPPGGADSPGLRGHFSCAYSVFPLEQLMPLPTMSLVSKHAYLPKARQQLYNNH